ncbi:MAG: lamin tail domain-containing protein [Oligoflexia bacterium]|nr:lamin tail domain-containing protein [Oligoflexia bacterium]
MAPALCINEIMPGNDAALILEDGSHPDWIEIFNPTDEAISLDGWTISDDRSQPDKHTLSGDLSVPPGGPLLLYADDNIIAGPQHLGFKLEESGEEVALFDPEGDGTVVAFGVVYPDFAVARSDDCCTGKDCLEHVFRGTPGERNGVVKTEDVELVAAASTWRYRDDGALTDSDWMLAAYDDSAWASGVAPLGYGDSQTTVVSYGADANAKYTTTWFRLAFDPADAGVADLSAVTAAQVGLMRDDGALVWLNGTEIARSNMPTGDVTAATMASVAVSGGDETAFFEYSVDASVLVSGTNVLAVEIHQATPTSSDITLDLKLSVTRVVSDR